jgi:uncharacterized membrane protein YczE
METIGTAAFIGLIVIALTQQIKFVSAQVTGLVTFIVAILIGLIIGAVDRFIGLPDVTVGFAIWTAVGAVGAHTLAASVNSGVKTPAAPKA